MNRRQFIASSVLSGISGVCLGVIGRPNTDTTLDIKIYQTENFTEHIRSEKQSDWAIDVAHKTVPPVIEQDFPDVSVTITQGGTNFSQSITDPRKSKDGLLSRSDSLQKWVRESKSDSVQNANILLGLGEFDEETMKGISNVPIHSQELNLLDGHSVVWYDKTTSLPRLHLSEILLHEIGHCMGLRHYHGGNVQYAGEEMLSLMSTLSFAELVGTNVFGDKVTPVDTRGDKFYPKITLDMLEL